MPAYGGRIGIQTLSLLRRNKPYVLHGIGSTRMCSLRRASGKVTTSRAKPRRYLKRPATSQLWFTTKANTVLPLKTGSYETPQQKTDTASETRACSEPTMRWPQTLDAAAGRLLWIKTRGVTRNANYERATVLSSEVIHQHRERQRQMSPRLPRVPERLDLRGR